MGQWNICDKAGGDPVVGKSPQVNSLRRWLSGGDGLARLAGPHIGAEPSPSVREVSFGQSWVGLSHYGVCGVVLICQNLFVLWCRSGFVHVGTGFEPDLVC